MVMEIGWFPACVSSPSLGVDAIIKGLTPSSTNLIVFCPGFTKLEPFFILNTPTSNNIPPGDDWKGVWNVIEYNPYDGLD